MMFLGSLGFRDVEAKGFGIRCLGMFLGSFGSIGTFRQRVSGFRV